MAYYLYNGVELPALPEWDKETHPYAVIRVATFALFTKALLYIMQDFHLYDADSFQSTTGDMVCSITWTTANGMDTDAEWSEFGETGTSTFGLAETIWSNFDIYNEDGTLYLAASEPVPVSTPNAAYAKALLMGYRTGCSIHGQRRKGVES